jgi:hypothetical protein
MIGRAASAAEDEFADTGIGTDLYCSADDPDVRCTLTASNRGLAKRSVQNPAGDVGADQVEQFVGAAGENRPNRVQREALCLLG